MEIINNLVEIPNLSIALGFFDGVHLGHQAVIKCAVDYAKINNTKSAVITFKQHPRCYINNVTPKYILPKEDRYKIIENLGIDYLVEFDFESVRNMTPGDYLENILIKYFSPVAISTGFNHHFGLDKSGDVMFLSDNQKRYDYTYSATPQIDYYGATISSTAIRNFISNGDIEIANDMLGRDFYIKGNVVEGQKIGRTIGFPTANVSISKDIIQPATGVYKVSVQLNDNKIYDGLANFGLRPTVSNSDIPTLEVHIIDFNQDIYGQEIKVNFKRRIRPEIKFSNIEELKTQLILDLQSLQK